MGSNRTIAWGNSVDAITFKAIFSKVATTVDGGWNLTLSVSQDDSQALLQLAELREQVLAVAIVPDNIRQDSA